MYVLVVTVVTVLTVLSVAMAQVLTLTSGTQVHFWDTDRLDLIKTLDCPIVNPTLGGRANIQVLQSYFFFFFREHDVTNIIDCPVIDSTYSN